MTVFTGQIVILGHYGAGKTNLALNLARGFAAVGERTALVDLDVVNPYFRAAEFTCGLSSNLTLVASEYAGSALDIPAVTPRVRAVFEGGFDRVVFDVGGDSAGAVAMGMFAARIKRRPHEVLYLINRYRPQTAQPEAAVDILREIEAASRLRATALVNGSHLGPLTTAADVAGTRTWADECARLCGLPLKCTLLPPGISRVSLGAQEPLLPISILVQKPWEEGKL